MNPPGAAYVYFNYGMYWLFNLLVKGGSRDGLVLIRALEPVRGVAAKGPVRAVGSVTQGLLLVGRLGRDRVRLIHHADATCENGLD